MLICCCFCRAGSSIRSTRDCQFTWPEYSVRAPKKLLVKTLVRVLFNWRLYLTVVTIYWVLLPIDYIEDFNICVSPLLLFSLWINIHISEKRFGATAWSHHVIGYRYLDVYPRIILLTELISLIVVTSCTTSV